MDLGPSLPSWDPEQGPLPSQVGVVGRAPHSTWRVNTEEASSSLTPPGPEMGTEEAGSSHPRHQVCPGPGPATVPGDCPGKQRPGGLVVSQWQDTSLRSLSSHTWSHTWRGCPQPGCCRPHARGAFCTRKLLPPAPSDARGVPLSLLCGGHHRDTLERVPAPLARRTFGGTKALPHLRSLISGRGSVGGQPHGLPAVLLIETFERTVAGHRIEGPSQASVARSHACPRDMPPGRRLHPSQP